jgi:site-specific DNA-adenine methylase
VRNGAARPVLRYHGGKFRLAPRLIEIFPPHRVYTEVFGGGASVLFHKPRCYSEIYNDLDGEVVNVFLVLQDRATRVLSTTDSFMSGGLWSGRAVSSAARRSNKIERSECG